MSADGGYLLTSPANKLILQGFLAVVLAFGLQPVSAVEEECDYGPPNLIKTVKTPFSATGPSEEETESSKAEPEFGSISLSPADERPAQPTGSAAALSPVQKLSLKEHLIGYRLYLPERMLIGTPAKFTVKARPGMTVAIAMADRDKGAKPVGGRSVRLGPDRKVVAISKIPESGLAEIFVETPIEGDLIGQFLFFEAAIWSKEDMSDVELAETVTSTRTATPANAVMVAQTPDTKRGVRIVPDSAMPLIMRQGSTSLSSGQP